MRSNRALKDKQVKDARIEVRSGGVIATIAKRMDVSPHTLYQAIHGMTRRDIVEPPPLTLAEVTEIADTRKLISFVCIACKDRLAEVKGRCIRCHAFWKRTGRERPNSQERSNGVTNAQSSKS